MHITKILTRNTVNNSKIKEFEVNSDNVSVSSSFLLVLFLLFFFMIDLIGAFNGDTSGDLIGEILLWYIIILFMRLYWI